MEFKIVRTNFLDALTKAQGIVERKTTTPILSNVLLDADRNGVKLTATDHQVTLIVQINAQVIQPGKITVLARSLFDIVREINQMELTLSLKENDRIEIIAGQSQFTIPGIAAKDFPQLPDVEEKSNVVSVEVFQEMMEKTAYAIATDDTRHNLGGIFFDNSKESAARMVATDGHRLAMIEKNLNIEATTKSVIIPRKGVYEIKKLIGKDGEMELAIGQKTLCVRKGNETLIVRLIEGDYPDYHRIIPTDSDKFASVSKEALVGALKRVSLLSNERSRGVLIKFSPGRLEISTNNPDLGEAREEIEADYKSESMAIGFNAKYFLEALSVVRDETIILAFRADLSPCIIKTEKDSGYLGVVMPMRL